MLILGHTTYHVGVEAPELDQQFKWKPILSYLFSPEGTQLCCTVLVAVVLSIFESLACVIQSWEL